MARVYVAMSGGVDSSVAAALLVRQGHEVVGVTMDVLGDDATRDACAPRPAEGAALVCASLGIPHLTRDMREVFEREVVSPYVDEYGRGRTPNPCVTCNERVKLGALLDRALADGAEALATGHHARIVETPDGLRIARGADRAKDQSYFLYRVQVDALSHLVLPVGGMTKGEVRTLAAETGLPCADAADSQEACFVPGGDTAAFLRERVSAPAGGVEVADLTGRVLGRVPSLGGLTVGQRLSPGGGGGGRRYVVVIDAAAHRVTVGPAEALDVDRVRASSPVWHGGEGRTDGLTARVRYGGAQVGASARFDGSELLVEFAVPVRGVAPGQSVVCWDGDIVIGGGVIEGAA